MQRLCHACMFSKAKVFVVTPHRHGFYVHEEDTLPRLGYSFSTKVEADRYRESIKIYPSTAPHTVWC